MLSPRVAAKILIIDDNVSLAEKPARPVLEGAKELDVHVKLARRRAARGFKAAQREGFDVAVVDIKLPDASGVDPDPPAPRLRAPRGRSCW